MNRQHKRGASNSKGATVDAAGRAARLHRETALIYGFHAARAAIANPQRTIRSVLATTNAAERLADTLGARGLTPRLVRPENLNASAGGSAVHQGVVVEAGPLPGRDPASLGAFNLVIVLDQITDPQNVGAILRSAAAFGADGLVMTARHSPPLEGALAKAASGALEHVPVALVPNLARALDELGNRDVMRIGLDSDGDQIFEDMSLPERLALVLGAEDKGLRRLTREKCDAICALGAAGAIRSLNVSNAAAIAMHHAWLSRRRMPG